jgi:hypothetical protein
MFKYSLWLFVFILSRLVKKSFLHSIEKRFFSFRFLKQTLYCCVIQHIVSKTLYGLVLSRLKSNEYTKTL